MYMRLIAAESLRTPGLLFPLSVSLWPTVMGNFYSIKVIIIIAIITIIIRRVRRKFNNNNEIIYLNVFLLY